MDWRLKFISILGCGLAALLSVLFYRPSNPEPATPEAIRAFIQVEAQRYRLDPDFVFAVAQAESSLRPHASSGYARGLMQVSAVAWKTVREDSYRNAWDWKENVRAGVAYLAHCRDFLNRNGKGGYPLMAACYRFGPYEVKSWGFDLKKLPRIRNKKYREILLGD